MKKFYPLIVLLVFTFVTQCYGETGTAEAKSPTAPENSPLPLKDYSGDLCSRPNLLGDWSGKRNNLAEEGITFETWVTQAFMGNARGGLSTKNGFRYSGSIDYVMTFDLGRLSLVDDASIFLRGETKWGDGIDPKVGSIAPVNLDAILPTFQMGNESVECKG